MESEHPIASHTEQLVTLRRDVDDHEERIRKVETTSTKREEQVKGLYENVGAIKELLSQQAVRLEAMMSNIDNKLAERLEKFEERLKELESADGKKWQQAVWIVFSLVAGAIAGTLFGK